jgi:hypothetical protein
MLKDKYIENQEVSVEPMQQSFQFLQDPISEDANNTTIASNHEVELVKFEYPVIGQVYLDPVAIYMEKLFITEPQCISSFFVMCHDYQAPCDEDHDGKHFMMPMQVLFLILIENIERAELLEKFLEWLHWHYCII